MKLIILDRDGVINYDSPDFIKSPEEWQPIPGSLEAIALLNKSGFTVSIATNQSGIARGLYTLEVLNNIHQKMNRLLEEQQGKIDQIVFCPHVSEEGCLCRKPKPGLYQSLANHYKVDLKLNNIACIGDSLRDLEAASSAGARPILVLTGNGQKTLNTLPEKFKNISYFKDLATAAEALIHE